jgi:RNA polymerase sigma-70 factor (ECF subfamily)
MGGAPEPEDLETDIFRPRFEAAFDAHHTHVLAFALRRVDGRAMAEDVVSETFAVVWQKRDLIPNEPLAWIYAIARRVIANQRRSEARRGRLHDRVLAAGEIPSVGDAAVRVEERATVLGAFASLSETDQEVLRLIAWDDVSTAEGAQVLDCTPAAFRVRLHRARRALQRALEEAAVTHEFKPVAQPAPSTPQEAR